MTTALLAGAFFGLGGYLLFRALFPPRPGLSARLAAVPGIRITACPENDDALLMRLLPDTDVLWHVLK